MTAPFFPQRQHVAVKAEASEGVDETPADADVIAPVFDVDWVASAEPNEREAVQDSFSNLPVIIGERSAEITFSTEVKGSGTAGTAPPNLSAPLQACGFSETIVAATSVTYAPVTDQPTSVTVEFREGSTDTTVHVKKILGARGNVTFTGEKGGLLIANFTFSGVYVEPTEAAAQYVSPSISPNPEPFLNIAFSFQGVSSLKIQAWEVDMGVETSLRNDASAATGNTSAVIVGRDPVGSINPELTDVATINYFNNWTTNTEGVLSFVLGATAGNILTFNAPKTQITNITQGDRDQMRIEELELQYNQSAAGGNDELTLAFT